jgi:nucleotide-binding universal stress UspA family protein
MKTPPCILATTDFQNPSRLAAERAFRLAAETGAQLTLMHTIRQRVLDDLRHLLQLKAAPVEESILREAQDALTRLASDLEQAHGVKAGLNLATGKVLQSILEHASAIDADLLVFGSNNEDFLAGATASRLLRLTRLPMLVVKQAPQETYSRVLVPVDFSPVSATALRLACSLAPQAHIVLLHAYESPVEGKLVFAGVADEIIQQLRSSGKHEAQQQLRELAKEAGGSDQVTMLALHGNATHRILEQAAVQHCDLIVMGKQGKDMIEEFLLGSDTKHVLDESRCDVLVVS